MESRDCNYILYFVSVVRCRLGWESWDFKRVMVMHCIFNGMVGREFVIFFVYEWQMNRMMIM
jgi:hypothetical protein